MKRWKTRVFGDNVVNFYGWMFAGLVIIVGSLYLMKRGLDALDELSATAGFLSAIYLMLLGCFGVLLQSYLARVARNLEASAPGEADEANR